MKLIRPELMHRPVSIKLLGHDRSVETFCLGAFRNFGIRQIPKLFDICIPKILEKFVVIQTDRMRTMTVIGYSQSTSTLCDNLFP